MDNYNNHSPLPWELKSHFGQIADTGDYDGSYEITNGQISIITNDDDTGLQDIVEALNNSGAEFYANDKAMELYLCRDEVKQLNERVKELEGLLDLDTITKLRNYFREHDKTQFEHSAFNFLNRLIKSIYES